MKVQFVHTEFEMYIGHPSEDVKKTVGLELQKRSDGSYKFGNFHMKIIVSHDK